MTATIIAAGRHLDLVRSDGWEFVRRRTASAVVGILAITPDGELLLVEQRRIPVGGPVIELPAGLVGDEQPQAARGSAGGAFRGRAAPGQTMTPAAAGSGAGHAGGPAIGGTSRWAHAGESVAAAAIRELEEETGWTAARCVVLQRGPSSAGLASEIVTLVRADGLRRIGAGGGVAGEGIAVHAVPLATAPAWLAERAAAGALIDHKVQAALWWAAQG